MPLTKTCLIIGGGASGALTALALLRRNTASLRLHIVEPDPELGRGRAYSRSSDRDLLNVPASQMSADGGTPTEFVDWLENTHGIGRQLPSWPYVPRALYGEYLQWKTRPYVGKRLNHIRARVSKLERSGGAYQVELSDGERLTVDMIVICTGYVPAPSAAIDRQFSDAAKNKGILIIGSGLTAIDHWRAQKSRGAHEIVFLSRHGLIPLPYLDHPKAVKLPKLRGMTPRQILQVVRTFQASGKDQWQDIADALRPQAADIWTSWSNGERKQFVRHVKAYWEIIRHRIPEKIHSELLSDLRSGLVKITAGCAEASLAITSGPVRVRYRARGEVSSTEASYAAVFDASGAQIDQSLGTATGKVAGLRTSKLGFGFINESAPDLWIIGPASKASTWETAAIAEIRAQTEKVAQEILTATRRDLKFPLGRLAVHPTNVGETYGEHFSASLNLSRRLVKISFALLVHAVLPIFFVDYASDQIRNAFRSLLQRRLLTRKSASTRVIDRDGEKKAA